MTMTTPPPLQNQGADEDEYDFSPLSPLQPNKSWTAPASIGGEGREHGDGNTTVLADQVDFGVRSGGGGGGSGGSCGGGGSGGLAEGEDVDEPSPGGQACFGVRSRGVLSGCLLYTSPSPRDKRQSRMPSSA